ncbi:hypothetical protein BGW80DRAFT_1315794, partial [Lactifluus volemus]
TPVSELSLTFHHHHSRAQLPVTLLFLSLPHFRRLSLSFRPWISQSNLTSRLCPSL